MHQISPARSAEAVRSEEKPLTFRQAVLIGHFDTVVYLESDLHAVIYEAGCAAAEGVRARFAGVLQCRADEDVVVLQAGAGRPAGMVGRTQVAAGLGTTTGLAWLTGQLVQFRQLDAADCIQGPEVLIGHGVQRTVSVPIRGECQKACGRLEVGSADEAEFTRYDLSFLQEIASSLATAVGLHANRASRAERTDLVVERQAALTGKSDTPAGRQGPAGISYQQAAQGGTS